eukprot:4624233-Pleurochrysis_carterae.AAC.1
MPRTCLSCWAVHQSHVHTASHPIAAPAFPPPVCPGRLQILRDEWGFQGSVVTDWGAVVGRVEGVQSGCDLEMPASGGCNDCRVFEAAKAGKLSEKDLDTVVTRTTELILAGATRRAIGHAVGRAVGTDAAMAADAAEQARPRTRAS